MKNKFLKGLVASFALALSGAANAGLINISETELAINNTLVDFESFSTGAISSNDVNFQSAGLLSVEFIGSSIANGDVLNSGADGNGLAVQQGGLAIVDYGDSIEKFTSGSGFKFVFQNSLNQFGFQITDQINFNTLVETFSNGVLVDSIAYNPSGSFPVPSVFYQSDVSINEFRITNVGSAGGWGLDNIVHANVSIKEVPEPSSLAVFALCLIGLASRKLKKKLNPQV